jgi:hypothetical protein
MGKAVGAIIGGVILGAIGIATFGVGTGLFGAIVGGIGSSLGIGAIAAGAIAGGLYAAGLYGLSSLLKPKIPSLSDEFGRELQLNGDPVAPRKILYGEGWTAGTLRYRNTTGTDNKDLYLVIILAGHPINSVQAIEFDGETVTLDGSGNVTSPSKWVGLINVRFLLGSYDQLADATLVATFADWTDDHRLRGLPYAIVKLSFDEEDLNTVPQMRFKCRGREVYDPRKDSTNGGSGTHSLLNQDTWEWSDNTVLCGADYLRGVKYKYGAPISTIIRIAGMGVDDDRLDWANVIAEANVCDEDVDLAASGTQKRYTVNGFIDPRQDPGPNLRHFEVAMAGDITFADGKWRFFAGAYRAPTLHLEDKHFIGPLRHIVHKGESARVDTAQGVYASSTDSGAVVDYPPVRLPTANAGSAKVFAVDFALVNNSPQAQRCAKLLLEKEAAGKQITCTTSLYGYRAVPGETINVTHAAFGLTTQAMRVIDVQLTPVQTGEDKVGLAVDLTLEAGPSSLYAWDAEETAIAAAPPLAQALVPFTISIDGLFSGLINAGFGTGSLEGWTVHTGAGANWFISTSDPHTGTYHLQAADSVNSRIRNDYRMPVAEGDRVLAQGFVQTAGSGSASVRINIRFRDVASVLVNSAFGNAVTGTNYALSRTIGTAGAGVVFADFEFELFNVSGRRAQCDNAFMSIIPKDSDIDALQITNGPAEAGADVTAPRFTGTPALINGDFELGSKEGWITGAGGNDGTVVNAGSGAFRGTYVMELPVQSGSSAFQQTLDQPVAPGERVYVTCFAIAKNSATTSFRLRLDFFTAAGANAGIITAETVTAAQGASWVQLRGLLTAPANSASFRVTLLNLTGTVGDWWIDQVAYAIWPRNADINLGEASGQVDTDRIEDEAATEIYSLTEASVTVTNVAVTVMAIAVPAVSVAHVVQITATFDAWREEVGNYVVFLQRDGSATAHSSRSIVSNASPGERITLTAELSRPSATADTYELNYLGVDPGDVTEFRNLTMRVEIIKR